MVNNASVNRRFLWQSSFLLRKYGRIIFHNNATFPFILPTFDNNTYLNLAGTTK
jgi:hypothetical protein